MGQIIFEEIGDPQCVEVIQFEELGTQGIPGESAYQYAIRTGMFVGTEVEFYDRVVNEPIAAANAANQAAENANTAAGNVGDAVNAAFTSAQSADLAAQNANQAAADTILATDQAILATQDAVQAVIDSDAATDSATQAANNANSAASNANTAKDATILATEAANTAKDSANTAATDATDKAALANTATANANTATNNANQATSEAISAKNAANTAAYAATNVVTKSPQAMAMGQSFVYDWGNTTETSSFKGTLYTVVDGFKTVPNSLLRLSASFDITFRAGTSDVSNNVFLGFVKDVNNYLEIQINRSTITVNQMLSGAKTKLSSYNQPINVMRTDIRNFIIKIEQDSLTGNFSIIVFGATANYFYQANLPSITLAQGADYNKIGVKSVGSGNVDFVIYQ